MRITHCHIVHVLVLQVLHITKLLTPTRQVVATAELLTTSSRFIGPLLRANALATVPCSMSASKLVSSKPNMIMGGWEEPFRLKKLEASSSGHSHTALLLRCGDCITSAPRLLRRCTQCDRRDREMEISSMQEVLLPNKRVPNCAGSSFWLKPLNSPSSATLYSPPPSFSMS